MKRNSSVFRFRLFTSCIPAFLLLNLAAFAQSDSTHAKSDSTHLPFAIAKEKRLSEDDLKDKKEGVYVTGIPNLSSDPVNGIGIGAQGQIFFNGKKSDPFFEYTPYRAQLNVNAFYTTRDERELALEFEIPYIFNTKWRLHGEMGYEIAPNQLYFGVTEQSLKSFANNESYSAYQNSLTGIRSDYNTYQKEEAILNFIFERSFWESRMRVFLGYEMAKATYTTPLNDSSLVHKDFLSGKITGYGDVLVPVYQVGLIYDTRDLEDDPTKGSLFEIMEEASPNILGAQYNFNKLFIQYKYFNILYPEKFKKVVFAGFAGLNNIDGDAPFFEYQDAESSEYTILTLGGPQTLRGYVQGRFAARVMAFANVELRCRFAHLDIFRQHLTFSGVPFFDSGGAWDSFSRMSHLENLRCSEGLGLRIGWNENTVLRFDYAISNEDRQFFFGLQQPF